MDMQLHTENLLVQQVRTITTDSFTVEGDVILPGGLRDETHILAVHAMAAPESCEALQDRAGVTGRVIFHVVYTKGDHTKVESLEATADFRHVAEAEGVTPRSEVKAWLQTQTASAAVSGGRANLKAEICPVLQWTSSVPVEVVSSIAGMSAETQSRCVRVHQGGSSARGEALLREELPLERELDVRETLFARAVPMVQEVSAGPGRVGVNGSVYLEAVHACGAAGRPLVATQHMIPLDQSIEMKGSSGELLSGDVCVRDVAVASQETGDGERVLRAEILLGMDVRADSEKEVTLLQDAYTLDGDALTLQKRELNCCAGSHEQRAAESFRAPVVLENGAQPVRSVLWAMALPKVTAWEQQGSRLQVTGMMQTTLVYLSDDGATPFSSTVQLPIRAAFAVQAWPGDALILNAAETEAAAITSDRVEVRCVLHLQVLGNETVTAQVVTDVRTEECDAPHPGMMLCYAQRGESLWDVAKRYRVPVEQLHRLNPGAEEPLTAGQSLLVWRRGEAWE